MQQGSKQQSMTRRSCRSPQINRFNRSRTRATRLVTENVIVRNLDLTNVALRQATQATKGSRSPSQFYDPLPPSITFVALCSPNISLDQPSYSYRTSIRQPRRPDAKHILSVRERRTKSTHSNRLWRSNSSLARQVLRSALHHRCTHTTPLGQPSQAVD